MSDSIERRVDKLEARVGRRDGLPGDMSLWTDAELWKIIRQSDLDFGAMRLSKSDIAALKRGDWDSVRDQGLEILARRDDGERL